MPAKPYTIRLASRQSVAFAAALSCVGVLFSWVGTASAATTMGLTVGGAGVPLPNGFIACAEPGKGWALEAGGARIRPPTDPTSVGNAIALNVAKSASDCAKSTEVVTLFAIGKLPQIDRKTVEVDIDQGRAELSGSELTGSRLWWRSQTETGSDVCVGPISTGNQQHCAYAVSRELPADPAKFALYLLPAGAAGLTELYDANGRTIAPESLSVAPSRLVIDRVWPSDEVADLSAGEAVIALPHGEAVASVDCDRGYCRLESGMVSVRAVGATPQDANIRLQMRPHVFVRNGATLVDRVVHTLDFVYCPLSGVSVGPFRDVDAAHVVLRLDARCVSIADSLTWAVNGNPVSVAARYPDGDDLLVVLMVGHVTATKLNVVGYRGKNGTDVVATESLATLAAPRVQPKISLDGFGEIGFVPTNRSGKLTATAPKLHGRLVPLSVEGIYSIESDDKGGYRIKGLNDADGFVSLRFAVRDSSLPGDLAKLDLAVVDMPGQRELRSVNVAAPVAVAVHRRAPFVELICDDKNGRPMVVLPGTSPHLPFASRDSCRLLLHRERILEEDGEQVLDVRVDVRSASGSSRSDGDLHQRLVLRHGKDPMVLWLSGVESQFDKLSVHISHILDESQYLRDGSERLEVPAATYAVVFENTSMRFYATVAIPTSLFRFSNEPNSSGNGALTLNLGVLSRLTWVTHDGSDGLFGLEAGVMGMGLSSQNTRQLNLVAGVGMAVPLGNTRQISQAAINLHAWIAYRPGRDKAPVYDALGNAAGLVELSNWSFVFGPSVTFGSVGLDL
jgi:hypothetical protein